MHLIANLLRLFFVVISSFLTIGMLANDTLQWSDLQNKPVINLYGTERPIVGDSLYIYSDSDLLHYSFKWTKGDAFGTFDDNILSLTKEYVITENDYEHWLRVSVYDESGEMVFSNDIWISKLPVIYIDTEDGKAITSKSNYISASLRIQGNSEYEQQYVGTTEIRGRGNSSWNTYPQKPYKLKLSKKTNLFGFSKSKHWVLISNWTDRSCLRNYTASRLAKQLGIIGMNMTWVDVVLNGEVKGCYMLSQHIRVDKNSVDIFDWEKEAEDVANELFYAVKDANALDEADKELLEEKMTTNLSWVTDGMVAFKGRTYNLSDYNLKKEYDLGKGYLFEASQKQGKTHFVTPGGINFDVDTPEYLSTNSDMMSYATELWKNFEAEYSQEPTLLGKNFSKYANMESMVGIWLVNEIMGQSDPINSRFSYIDNNGIINFGPAWDFDHSSGSMSTKRDVNFFWTMYDEMTAASLWRHTYYQKWFPDPVLCQMAYDAYWNVARPFIMDFTSEGGEMDAKYALFAEAGRTNDALWITYPERPWTTETDVKVLKKFLLGHIQWLDEQFSSVQTLIEAMNTTCIYPCNPDIIDRIQTTTSDKQTDTHKFIKDKHLYIIKDDKTYSVDGKCVK